MDTFTTQRTELPYPTLELETPYGAITLQLGSGKRASVTKSSLTINRIAYEASASFEIDKRDGKWHWKYSDYYRIKRSKGDWNSGATSSAHDVIRTVIFKLVTSYLDTSPDILLEAEKVKINNEIVDSIKQEEVAVQALHGIRDERKLLESKESELKGEIHV
jgi:hypothetical protein